MDSESHDIVPINSQCQGRVETKIVSQPGTDSNQAAKDIQNTENQQAINAQYDSVDDMKVKPMYGGNMLFKIIFRNKVSNIYQNNEKNAIKELLNNKIYKKDHLLEIFNNKNVRSVYIIRGNYKNKFKKIY